MKTKVKGPVSLGIVRDASRRGGWRVVRVHVILSLELLKAAEVEEVNWPRSHWLPFDRMAKHPRRAAKLLRALLPKLTPAPGPGLPADSDQLAETGAVQSP